MPFRTLVILSVYLEVLYTVHKTISYCVSQMAGLKVFKAGITKACQLIMAILCEAFWRNCDWEGIEDKCIWFLTTFFTLLQQMPMLRKCSIISVYLFPIGIDLQRLIQNPPVDFQKAVSHVQQHKAKSDFRRNLSSLARELKNLPLPVSAEE